MFRLNCWRATVDGQLFTAMNNVHMQLIKGRPSLCGEWHAKLHINKKTTRQIVWLIYHLELKPKHISIQKGDYIKLYFIADLSIHNNNCLR